MPIKTSVLILILGLFVVFLLFFAIRQENKIYKETKIAKVSPAPTITLEKKAELFFVPSSIDLNENILSESQKNSADIFLNSYNDKVSAFQIELSYNPKIIDNLQINIPGDPFFLGKNYKILFQNIDPQNGRISLAVSSNANETYAKGVGKAATISFGIKKDLKTDAKESRIIFLDKTTVSSPYSKDSLLKTTIPLTINF